MLKPLNSVERNNDNPSNPLHATRGFRPHGRKPDELQQLMNLKKASIGRVIEKAALSIVVKHVFREHRGTLIVL